MTAGQIIKNLRGDIPRKTVADIVGVTISSMSNYENDIRVPCDPVKKRIADFFGKTVDEIFYATNDTVCEHSEEN